MGWGSGGGGVYFSRRFITCTRLTRVYWNTHHGCGSRRIVVGRRRVWRIGRGKCFENRHKQQHRRLDSDRGRGGCGGGYGSLQMTRLGHRPSTTERCRAAATAATVTTTTAAAATPRGPAAVARTPHDIRTPAVHVVRTQILVYIVNIYIYKYIFFYKESERIEL